MIHSMTGHLFHSLRNKTLFWRCFLLFNHGAPRGFVYRAPENYFQTSQFCSVWQCSWTRFHKDQHTFKMPCILCQKVGDSMPKTSEAVPLISKSSSSESSAAAPLLNSALSSLAGKDFQIFRCDGPTEPHSVPQSSVRFNAQHIWCSAPHKYEVSLISMKCLS